LGESNKKIAEKSKIVSIPSQVNIVTKKRRYIIQLILKSIKIIRIFLKTYLFNKGIAVIYFRIIKSVLFKFNDDYYYYFDKDPKFKSKFIISRLCIRTIRKIEMLINFSFRMIGLFVSHYVLYRLGLLFKCFVYIILMNKSVECLIYYQSNLMKINSREDELLNKNESTESKDFIEFSNKVLTDTSDKFERLLTKW